MACLNFLARVLWHLGYPDQALHTSDRALTLAQELAHPFSLAFALSWDAALHQLRRERQAVQERAEADLVLSTEQGFAFYAAHALVLGGWARVEQGQGEAGIAQIRQGIAAYRATWAETERSHWLALLAEAHGSMRQIEEGMNVLNEALAGVQQQGGRYYEAELYRLKGELTRKQSSVSGLESRDQKEAEACFHKAIEIARRQQAKSLELRAVMSLARLWQQQGKMKEAHKTLADIYGWFTEGFDTKDLQEAKALLESLR